MKMSWKQLTTCLMGGMLIGSQGLTTVQAQTASLFTDIGPGFWASPAISRLAERDVITGYADNTFRPGNSVTRAEFATMLVKGFNPSTTVSSAPGINDISGHWAQGNIQRVINAGLMSGTANGYFLPNQPITRAEAIVTLHKVAMLKTGQPALSQAEAQRILSPLGDEGQIPSWAFLPVASAYRSGILTNEPYAGQMILPLKSATRGEIANMIARTRVEIGMDPPLPGMATAVAPTIQTAPPIVVTPVAERLPLTGTTQVVAPSMDVVFNMDIDPAKTKLGQDFNMTTSGPLMVDNQMFPAGSILTGQVAGMQRPATGTPGQVQLVMTGIHSPNNERIIVFERPEALQATAGIIKEEPRANENILVRTLASPFRITGGALTGVASTGQAVFGDIFGPLPTPVVNANATALQYVSECPAGCPVTATPFPVEAKARPGLLQQGGNLVGGVFQRTGNTVGSVVSGTGNIISLTSQELFYIVNPNTFTVEKIAGGQAVPVSFIQTRCSQ